MLHLLRRSGQLRTVGHDQVGVAAVLAFGIAIAVWLMGCSAGQVTVPFQLRPVLSAQPGSCPHRSDDVPGIHGGCYHLAAAAFGVKIANVQGVHAFRMGRGYVVVLVLGPDARPAVLRMMQPPSERCQHPTPARHASTRSPGQSGSCRTAKCSPRSRRMWVSARQERPSWCRPMTSREPRPKS